MINFQFSLFIELVILPLGVSGADTDDRLTYLPLHLVDDTHDCVPCVNDQAGIWGLSQVREPNLKF